MVGTPSVKEGDEDDSSVKEGDEDDSSVKGGGGGFGEQLTISKVVCFKWAQVHFYFVLPPRSNRSYYSGTPVVPNDKSLLRTELIVTLADSVSLVAPYCDYTLSEQNIRNTC